MIIGDPSQIFCEKKESYSPPGFLEGRFRKCLYVKLDLALLKPTAKGRSFRCSLIEEWTLPQSHSKAGYFLGGKFTRQILGSAPESTIEFWGEPARCVRAGPRL